MVLPAFARYCDYIIYVIDIYLYSENNEETETTSRISIHFEKKSKLTILTLQIFRIDYDFIEFFSVFVTIIMVLPGFARHCG